MTTMDDKTPREEDFRDFEARNVSDGWPYSDTAGAKSKSADNAAYGETAANFDSERNSGFRVDGSDDTGRENDLKDSLRPETIHREDSDELEVRVTENLENIPELDLNNIEVHADGHTVTLDGSVDTVFDKRRAELGALSVDGVHKIRNHLETTGIDSRFPNDD